VVVVVVVAVVALAAVRQALRLGNDPAGSVAGALRCVDSSSPFFLFTGRCFVSERDRDATAIKNERNEKRSTETVSVLEHIAHAKVFWNTLPCSFIFLFLCFVTQPECGRFACAQQSKRRRRFACEIKIPQPFPPAIPVHVPVPVRKRKIPGKKKEKRGQSAAVLLTILLRYSLCP
jgi:hypothetical protein